MKIIDDFEIGRLFNIFLIIILVWALILLVCAQIETIKYGKLKNECDLFEGCDKSLCISKSKYANEKQLEKAELENKVCLLKYGVGD